MSNLASDDFMENVQLLNPHKNELIIADVRVGSELALFLDYKALPYEKRPQIESSKFSVGALRDMLVLNVEEQKEDDIVIAKNYIIVVGNIKPKRSQPSRFNVSKSSKGTFIFSGEYYEEEEYDGYVQLRA